MVVMVKAHEGTTGGCCDECAHQERVFKKRLYKKHHVCQVLRVLKMFFSIAIICEVHSRNDATSQNNELCSCQEINHFLLVAPHFGKMTVRNSFVMLLKQLNANSASF